MAGNTAVISMTQFAADWAAHIPIAVLCVRYTVTKDQVYRLRDVWNLTPRHDRSLRVKPRWSAKPSRAEEAASKASCDLAPEIARRVAELKEGVGGVKIVGMYARSDERQVPFSVPIIAMRDIRKLGVIPGKSDAEDGE